MRYGFSSSVFQLTLSTGSTNLKNMSRPIPNPEMIDRLLSVIEQDILPLTVQGVASGNKVFGAAILRKTDFSLLLAETNNEKESPLWHGEMHVLKRYHEMPEASRPPPTDLLFLSTHEPCSLCMSAITWAGFDNFFYLFSHEDSRDAFAIPHDLKILKEVFDVDPGQYRSSNAFWDSFNLRHLVDQLDRQTKDTQVEKIRRIVEQYDKLSSHYQEGKTENSIPLN